MKLEISEKTYNELMKMILETEIAYKMMFQTMDDFILWILDTQHNQNENHY